jgi:predicted ArsR family transcriptional regulator
MRRWDKTMSVEVLAKHLGLDPKKVLRHIVVLRQRGLVALDRIEGEDPLYIALEVP